MEIRLGNIRALNESLMLDQVRIFPNEISRNKTWNEATGTYDTEGTVFRYDGKCNFWSARQGTNELVEGGELQVPITYFFEIPMDSPLVYPKDIIVLTGVNPEGNQQLLGQEFMVRSQDVFSYSVGLIIRADIREVSPK